MTYLHRCLLALLLTLTSACTQLPVRPELPVDRALPVQGTTRLDAEVAPAAAKHPGMSGFRLVSDGLEAFALRGYATRSAGRSLDVQSYIWNDDLTGRLLAREVLEAADRGLRVRVLLDDMDARAKGGILLALDTHPNISIRVFNPFATRSGMIGTAMEAASTFKRINRRAHNKSWIVDGRLAITGGRNVGDEYFMASAQANFQDLDLLVAGPAVDALSQVFDGYWNASAGWPIQLVDRRVMPANALEDLRQGLQRAYEQSRDASWVQALGDVDSLARIRVGYLGMQWTTRWQSFHDDPEKLLRPVPAEQASPVLAGLLKAMREGKGDIVLISPYFVPGDEGAALLARAARDGRSVRILTNSLASNDVAAVHAGYARHRRTLLESGVQLWELKPRPGQGGSRLFGSSGTSLHAKAAVLDGEAMFVGSLNLDPRSVRLNSEQGLLLTNPVLATQLLALFDTMTSPANAWALRWDPASARLHWQDAAGTRDREPGATASRRAAAALARWLPIEELL